MKYSLKLIVLLFLIFTSCKSKKNIVGGDAVKSVSTKRIIHNHYEDVFDQQTIDAKLNAKYKDKSKSVSINIKMRLEKDLLLCLLYSQQFQHMKHLLNN